MPLIRAKFRNQFGEIVDAAVQTDDIETVVGVTLYDISGAPLPDRYVRIRFRKTGLEQVYLGEVSDFLPGKSGQASEPERVVCPECQGGGRIVVGEPLGTCDGPQFGICPRCGGSGRL